jgi:hypothetical protein
MTNWSDPADRARLIEQVGVTQYNRQLREHHQRSIVATVNGHPIRTVFTRFGLLFAVADAAFRTLAEAKAHAERRP